MDLFTSCCPCSIKSLLTYRYRTGGEKKKLGWGWASNRNGRQAFASLGASPRHPYKAEEHAPNVVLITGSQKNVTS